MNDYLRVIRLGYGKGEPGKQACWMTALQSHMGGEWTDRCECVDEVINDFCISINDLYYSNNEARTEGILNFGLFRVLGTAGTTEDSLRRKYHVLDTMIRQLLPLYLEFLTVRDPRPRLFRELPPVINRETLSKAWGLCKLYLDPCDYHELNFHLASISYVSAYFRVVRICLDKTGYAWPKFAKEYVFPLLAELVEMGPHAPDEPSVPACGVKEFHRLVGVK